MEVILTEKIKNLGNVGSTVNVKDGFAKNFLIPNQMALYATKQNKELLKQQLTKLEEKSNAKLAAAKEIAITLNNKAFIFIRNASEAGSLYGSVTVKDILANLEKGKITINSHQIKIKETIKTIGTYDVAIELHSDVVTNIIVVVARSKEDAEVMFKTHFDKLNKLAEEHKQNNEVTDKSTKTAVTSSKTKDHSDTAEEN